MYIQKLYKSQRLEKGRFKTVINLVKLSLHNYSKDLEADLFAKKVKHGSIQMQMESETQRKENR